MSAVGHLAPGYSSGKATRKFLKLGVNRPLLSETSIKRDVVASIIPDCNNLHVQVILKQECEWKSGS